MAEPEKTTDAPTVGETMSIAIMPGRDPEVSGDPLSISGDPLFSADLALSRQPKNRRR